MPKKQVWQNKLSLIFRKTFQKNAAQEAHLDAVTLIQNYMKKLLEENHESKSRNSSQESNSFISQNSKLF